MRDVMERGGSRPHGGPAARQEAERALERFRERLGDVRGAAILGAGGEVLAPAGEEQRWREPAAQLLAAADAALAERASHAHVATEEGEVYALRSGELAMVAVCDRFALASLVLSDMRAALRELGAPGRAA